MISGKKIATLLCLKSAYIVIMLIPLYCYAQEQIVSSSLCLRYFLPKQADRQYEDCVDAENEPNPALREYKLGTLLLPQELNQGRQFLKASSAHGNRDAMYALAQSYEVYKQKNYDTHESIYWYQKAAELNNPLAQARLGDIYFNGQGVTQNYTKAFHWYLRAANQGVPESQFSVAECYEKGRGVQQNYQLAFEWYIKAAEHGNVSAFGKLGDIFYYSEYGKQDYEQAAMWYKKAALLGSACAQYQLGAMFTSATGLSHNSKAGFYWLEQSAIQNFSPAQSLLGRLLMSTHEKYNFNQAHTWLQKAAQNGDAQASLTLGKMYRYGDGVPQDFKQAAKYFHQAALGGSVQGQAYLGMCYQQGLGMPKNYALAAKWYQQAAKQGNAQAQFNLSTLYQEGKGVNKDGILAYAWADVAAASGLESATEARRLIGNWLTYNELRRAQMLAGELVDKQLPALGTVRGIDCIY
ncbi:MAG: sel1 repeat family protein [Proteobacteria bacterium]|nr:sel1 repeat family protein [Pseudomonadota bacterium]